MNNTVGEFMNPNPPSALSEQEIEQLRPDELEASQWGEHTITTAQLVALCDLALIAKRNERELALHIAVCKAHTLLRKALIAYADAAKAST